MLYTRTTKLPPPGQGSQHGLLSPPRRDANLSGAILVSEADRCAWNVFNILIFWHLLKDVILSSLFSVVYICTTPAPWDLDFHSSSSAHPVPTPPAPPNAPPHEWMVWLVSLTLGCWYQDVPNDASDPCFHCHFLSHCTTYSLQPQTYRGANY